MPPHRKAFNVVRNYSKPLNIGILDKIFGKTKKAAADQTDSEETSEHAVIVKFNYGRDDLNPLFDLEEKIEKIIAEEGVGEYDGHEISVSYNDGILYMYGPNAEDLFNSVRPVLAACSFMKGATATLRFGPPEDGVKRIEVEI